MIQFSPSELRRKYSEPKALRMQRMVYSDAFYQSVDIWQLRPFRETDRLCIYVPFGFKIKINICFSLMTKMLYVPCREFKEIKKKVKIALKSNCRNEHC